MSTVTALNCKSVEICNLGILLRPSFPQQENDVYVAGSLQKSKLTLKEAVARLPRCSDFQITAAAALAGFSAT